MLSLSKGTNYSILVLDYLFSLPPDQVKTNAELADILNLPPDFLSKILQKLTHSGIIRSIKGINGGYMISDASKNITLKMIVDCIDGPTQLKVDLCNSTSGSKQNSVSNPVIETMNNFESELNYLMERINFFKN